MTGHSEELKQKLDKLLKNKTECNLIIDPSDCLTRVKGRRKLLDSLQSLFITKCYCIHLKVDFELCNQRLKENKKKQEKLEDQKTEFEKPNAGEGYKKCYEIEVKEKETNLEKELEKIIKENSN